MSRIGIISDTHGLVRPQALCALASCMRILHAGDIGGGAILAALSAIAPVTAVRGNNDIDAWGTGLPACDTVTFDGVRIHLLHDIADLAFDPVTTGVRVVISGHSHKPAISGHRGVLYINPGSAGPRRFRLPISVAILEINGGKVTARLVELTLPPIAGQRPTRRQAAGTRSA